MQKNFKIHSILFLAIILLFTACKKDYGNLNNATVEDLLKNATQSELNNLVSGTESGMRVSLNF